MRIEIRRAEVPEADDVRLGPQRELEVLRRRDLLRELRGERVLAIHHLAEPALALRAQRRPQLDRHRALRALERALPEIPPRVLGPLAPLEQVARLLRERGVRVRLALE